MQTIKFVTGQLHSCAENSYMDINLNIWLVSKYILVSTNEEHLHVISDFYAPITPLASRHFDYSFHLGRSIPLCMAVKS